jgi:DNA-3-methyladenine glycosylase
MTIGHMSSRLPRVFYEDASIDVARALLGQRLVRMLGDQRLSGIICETEAYGGPEDQASHAFRRTPRSAIMYGPPGHAYVYFIYGMHFCLNAVTGCDGCPGAVLIRGIIPQEGLETMRELRGVASDRHLCDGPGKVCRALGITGDENRVDLVEAPSLFLEAGPGSADGTVRTTPRIGVRGDELALARPWRLVWQPPQPQAD